MSDDRDVSFATLVITGAEVMQWAAMVATSPSPTAYLAVAIIQAVFRSD